MCMVLQQLGSQVPVKHDWGFPVGDPDLVPLYMQMSHDLWPSAIVYANESWPDMVHWPAGPGGNNVSYSECVL